MLFLLTLLQLCFAYDYFELKPSYRRNFQIPYFNETFFSALDSYQVNAKPVSASQYPWIARVVHSMTLDSPHICTASCIHEGIFITAASCIIGLKVAFTALVYQSHRLPVRAFVIPSNGTKQSFDDIGFIVMHTTHVPWIVMKLFGETNRTDAMFQWFERMKASEYKVVGYAMDKGIHRIKTADRLYTLTELSIVIGLKICATILTYQNYFRGFNIPCYHSCTIAEFNKKVEKCKNYHGVDGGAVFDVEKKHLLGVATWGQYYPNYELPVGFSVVNSDNFFQDYKCAKKIWADKLREVNKGYYQKLCDS